MNVEKITPAFSDARGEIADILQQTAVDYVTMIKSTKGAVRANHYHKETTQWVYMLAGHMRVVAQVPGEKPHEVFLGPGDLIVHAPMEAHAFESLDDSSMLVFTRGPRGGENYEKDTFRLDVPLIPPSPGAGR